MDELILMLKELFEKNKNFYTFASIKKLLNIKGEEKNKILSKALNEMVESGDIFYDKKLGYRAFPTKDGYAFGTLYLNKVGTGFVTTNDGYTILIENSDLNGALNGDSVIVYNIFQRVKDYFHGEIYKVTKRKTGKILYEVVGSGDKATLVPYNQSENVPVYINKNDMKKLMDGDVILVKVGCNMDFGMYEGYIDNIVGHITDPDIDIKLICNKYGIPYVFSKNAKEEADKMKEYVDGDDLTGRVDLRKENIFTIDCDNTKDRDDSVGIKKLDNGNYLLKVNISHVSHYISKDSAIFKEALMRTTSHYLGNSVIPMIPSKISNGICSLEPGKDRLTKTVELEINNNGEVVNYNIYDSAINSRLAMSYSNVNKVLNGEQLPEYLPYKEDLELMKELNDILEKARDKRNYINFDTPEVETIQDKESNTTIFSKLDYGTAGKIIENFMLVANETVYKHFAWHILAYRVHEFPDEKKVREILKILKSSGIKLPKIENIDSRSLKTIINSLNDDEISQIVKEYLLKGMKKARYDTKNVGHFALQYDTYGHFTSPIRRIMDLIMHMTIDDIENFDYSENSVKSFENFLNDICEKTNKIEKIDELMTNEYLEMKMAEYMKDHIGEEFEVYVTDILKRGMIVRTKNLIKGKVRIDDMEDDQYHYDESTHALIGRNTKKKYQLGNKLCVLVKDASKESATIYFSLPKQKVKVKNTY